MGEALSATDHSGRRHCRVLIIKDDADAAESLREVLELEGHEIAVAHDASQGISRAREFHPDAVVCEIGLPDLDGFAVARALQAEPSLRNACLVALSGYGTADDREQARRAGFMYHFPKALIIEALQQLLRELPPNDSV